MKHKCDLCDGEMKFDYEQKDLKVGNRVVCKGYKAYSCTDKLCSLYGSSIKKN